METIKIKWSIYDEDYDDMLNIIFEFIMSGGLVDIYCRTGYVEIKEIIKEHFRLHDIYHIDDYETVTIIEFTPEQYTLFMLKYL